MLTVPTDTVAAIATPLGFGGLAIVRISGPGAIPVADRIFTAAGSLAGRLEDAASHTVHYGWIVQDGKRLDEVLVAVFRAPRTFTREDIAEISCHGGSLVAKLILEAACRAGARIAEPGEFTKRAFLNGRIDLTQAEAVADVIHAQTELALAAAQGQLAGRLSRRINEVRDRLMLTLAHIEAHLDFPDEDITPDTQTELLRRIQSAVAFMTQVLRGAREGKILREGVRTAIVGRPNAGKSSLLNQLVGTNRAIVSAIPGTTRDTIEETANVRGIPVVFVDTAGLRDSKDEIEQEGIRRSRQAAAAADLILHVFDGSIPFGPLDEELLLMFEGKPRVLVANKADIGTCSEVSGAIAVSCATGAGLEQLLEEMARVIWQGDAQGSHGEACINARHQEALGRSLAALLRTQAAIESQLSLELAAFELRVAAQALGEVVGKTATDDLLDVIFSQFCLGK